MAKPDPILTRRLVVLSEQGDAIRTHEAVEGSLIIGSSGGGKTTTIGKNLAYSFLRTAGMGGVVLTAKSEETNNWIAYAKACGRENDLIRFNAESGLTFDPLHYESERGHDFESIIDLFSTLLSIGKQHVGINNDRFWELAVEQLIRNVLVLLSLAGEAISIVNIHRVIRSLPTRPGEHEDEAWQRESFCASLISAIRARKDTLSESQWSDLDYATQFVFSRWPAYDEKPRSSIEMTWAGMGDKFLFNPFNRLFCSGRCSFTPEMTTHEGKIILCDFPMLQWGQETGRLINIIIKLIFQRAWLRRDLSESPNPVFLWQDEFHYFVTRFDNFFQTTCRGSRVAVVCLTQNILNLAETLGEPQPGAKTKSFLANLGTKYFLQQNCPDTCLYAADQIGKEYRYLDSYNAGGDQHHTHAGVSGSKQLTHIIEPVEFTRLAKPDSNNPYAEAIVYQSGKTFNATRTEREPDGRNYLRVLFSRETT